eukprot:scaffold77326_cov69-Phaeocystis_antarctica.AAC.3
MLDHPSGHQQDPLRLLTVLALDTLPLSLALVEPARPFRHDCGGGYYQRGISGAPLLACGYLASHAAAPLSDQDASQDGAPKM